MTWNTVADLGAADPIPNTTFNNVKNNAEHLFAGGDGDVCRVTAQGAIWGAFAAGVWTSIESTLFAASFTPASQFAWCFGCIPVYASVANTAFYISLNVNGTIIATAAKGIGQWYAGGNIQSQANQVVFWYPLLGLTAGAVNTVIPVIKPITNTVSIDVVNQYALLAVKEGLFGG